MGEEAANPPESSKSCEECKSNPSKYKCPACSLRSCSLPCVKAHKLRTGCTGKRQHHAHVVPLSQFDDNLLLSDFNMLEDVKRIADSAKRTRMQICGQVLHWTTRHLKYLQKAAGRRRTKLLFLPSGMSKRETNQTCYHHRNNLINWTIEWRFHSTDVKLIDHRVDENSNLYSVIENHLKPGPINHLLRPFGLEPMESLRFFIRKYPKGPKSPFRELDIKASIREQLANLVILEYPVVYVFLPSHNLDFEIVKDPFPRQVQPKNNPVSESQLSPKGRFFKEEEIKDDLSTEPQILDLMEQTKTRSTESNKSGENCVVSNAEDNKMGVVDFIDFDFDPELIDVYSNLISDTNPDDYLDLEGLLCDDMQIREEKGEVKEELEEGEIPDSD